MALTGLGVLVVSSLWLLWPTWSLLAGSEALASGSPSRLYGRSGRLDLGAVADLAPLAAELEGQGYRRVASSPGRGELAGDARHLVAGLRPRPTPAGWESGGRLEVTVEAGRVRRLLWQGAEVQGVELPPPLVASLYDDALEDRWPLRLADLPEHVPLAVLAAEDAGFYLHAGISPSGVLRAALENLAVGGIRQGGSTLTQQLAKNLFLTQERTFGRKLREAVLALLLELRFDKKQILEAYLNEAYWGQSGAVSVVGLGAASRYYFAKQPEELSVAEAALLAGMLPAPGAYSPFAHPDRAVERRDEVLARMEELGWLAAGRDPAPGPPRLAARRPLEPRAVPYFADRVAREALARFGVGALRGTGYTLLSSLHPADQKTAEEAVSRGLGELEAAVATGNPLQAALVSLDAASGQVLAWVGGRDYAESQFDRVDQALRQAGSCFKPVVYAAAFESGLAPATLLEDRPLTVPAGGRQWSPRNSDGRYRGTVSARIALEDSLNVPTVRLALAVGLPRIVELARELGVEGRLEPFPALALGAFEVTPLQLAGVYATLAAGGLRAEPHGLLAVLDPRGVPVAGEELPPPRPVLSSEAAYLVTSVLEGVLDRGTGREVRALGLEDRLAGKTGTSNERRDSWFLGYSPERVTAVWVGHDDNAPTPFSGSRAALPLWTRFSLGVRPGVGYPPFRAPAGITWLRIDPASGAVAVAGCPQAVVEAFDATHALPAECPLHGGAAAEAPEQRHPLRDWLRRVFGRDGLGVDP